MRSFSPLVDRWLKLKVSQTSFFCPTLLYSSSSPPDRGESHCPRVRNAFFGPRDVVQCVLTSSLPLQPAHQMPRYPRGELFSLLPRLAWLDALHDLRLQEFAAVPRQQASQLRSQHDEDAQVSSPRAQDYPRAYGWGRLRLQHFLSRGMRTERGCYRASFARFLILLRATPLCWLVAPRTFTSVRSVQCIAQLIPRPLERNRLEASRTLERASQAQRVRFSLTLLPHLPSWSWPDWSMSTDLPPQRRVTKTYGRRSLSSAARHASIPLATAAASSSDDDSSDGQVAASLLRSPTGGAAPGRVRGGGKPIVARNKSAPAGNGSGVGGAARAAGRPKELGEGAGTKVISVGASTVEWDEDVARRAVGSTGRGGVAASKGRTPRTASPLPSPSPPKRTRAAALAPSQTSSPRSSPRRAATTGSPSLPSSTTASTASEKRVDPPTAPQEPPTQKGAPTRKGKEKEVAQELVEEEEGSTAVEDNSPPRRKRPRIKVTSAITSSAVADILPTPSGALPPIPSSSQSQPPVKPTPTPKPRAALPRTIPPVANSIASTSTGPQTPTRSPASSPPIRSASSRPPTPLRSPAKNLASVFSSFAKPADESALKSKKLGRATSGVVASMGARTAPSGPFSLPSPVPVLTPRCRTPRPCQLFPPPLLPNFFPFPHSRPLSLPPLRPPLPIPALPSPIPHQTSSQPQPLHHRILSPSRRRQEDVRRRTKLQARCRGRPALRPRTQSRRRAQELSSRGEWP